MDGSLRRDRAGAFTPSSVIEQLREGMPVVDAIGERVGTVAYVQMGDPEAVTVAGNEPGPGDPISEFGRAIFGDEREPNVPGPKREQLLRSGFVKVDGPGLFGTARYVPGDQIARASGGTVVLTVRKDELPTER